MGVSTPSKGAQTWWNRSCKRLQSWAPQSSAGILKNRCVRGLLETIYTDYGSAKLLQQMAYVLLCGVAAAACGSHDTRPVSCAMLPTSLLTPLYKLQQSFVLVDPNMPDMPIVHASAGFLMLTGRPRSTSPASAHFTEIHQPLNLR